MAAPAEELATVQPASRKCDVLVVGAGIAGLTAAEAITRSQPERDLIIVEADRRAGGQIRTTVADGYTFEHGATALTTRRPTTRHLLERLGLVHDPASAGRSHVYSSGALHPVPRTPRELVRSGLISSAAKLRLLMEPVAGRPARAPDESVYELVARRFGDGVARVAATTALQGVTAGDARATSVRAVAPRLYAMDRAAGRAGVLVDGLRSGRTGARSGPCSFPDGGLQRLPEALSTALGARLRLQATVSDLRRDGAAGYVAQLDGAVVHAQHVLLAVPAGRAAALLHDLAPDAAEELAAISTAPLRVIGLGYPRAAFATPPDGVGFLAVPDERLGIIGAIFSSNLFPWQAPAGRVLVRAFLGGTFAPDAVLESTEAAIGRVARVLH